MTAPLLLLLQTVIGGAIVDSCFHILDKAPLEVSKLDMSCLVYSVYFFLFSTYVIGICTNCCCIQNRLPLGK